MPQDRSARDAIPEIVVGIGVGVGIDPSSITECGDDDHDVGHDVGLHGNGSRRYTKEVRSDAGLEMTSGSESSLSRPGSGSRSGSRSSSRVGVRSAVAERLASPSSGDKPVRPRPTQTQTAKQAQEHEQGNNSGSAQAKNSGFTSIGLA